MRDSAICSGSNRAQTWVPLASYDQNETDSTSEPSSLQVLDTGIPIYGPIVRAGVRHIILGMWGRSNRLPPDTAFSLLAPASRTGTPNCVLVHDADISASIAIEIELVVSPPFSMTSPTVFIMASYSART